MLAKIGPTLVCSGITNNEKLISDLTAATHIDRLNVGPIPTSKLKHARTHSRINLPEVWSPSLFG